MSAFKDIISELVTASHPIARALHKGEHFKVLALGFNKGMVLKDHQTHIKSKLTVLSGFVIYKEGDQVISLSQYDEVEIPINVTHSVEAVENSFCLLTQG